MTGAACPTTGPTCECDRATRERHAWARKHPDYRVTLATGERAVLIYRGAAGTCLEPLHQLSDDDLLLITGPCPACQKEP